MQQTIRKEEISTKTIQKEGFLENKKRIDYFDIAKGIGILLMIIGHMNLKKYPLINHFIYSFHMPLFFIISGYFFKVKEDKVCIKNIINKLIKPYIITCLFIIFIQVFKVVVSGNIDLIPHTIKIWGIASLYGSGSLKIFGMEQVIGAIWFLLAMAVATYILNKVYDKKYNWLYILIIAFVGYKTSKYIWLPFSIQAGMTATLFLYIGTLANKYNVFDKKIDILLYLFLIGIVTFCVKYGGKLYMVSNIYTNGLMDIIGALSGTFLCIKGSQLISKYTKYIGRFLIYLGKNSLLCLCIHLISLNCFSWKKAYSILETVGIKSGIIKQLLVNIVWVILALTIINMIKMVLSKRKKLNL